MTQATTPLNETQRDIAAGNDAELAENLIIWQQTVTALRNSNADPRSIAHSETVATWHEEEVTRRAARRDLLAHLRAIRAGAWTKVLAAKPGTPELDKAIALHRAAAHAVRAEQARQAEAR